MSVLEALVSGSSKASPSSCRSRAPRICACRAHELEAAIEDIAYTVGPDSRIALEVVPTSANFAPFRGAASVEIHRLDVGVPLTRPTGGSAAKQALGHRPAIR